MSQPVMTMEELSVWIGGLEVAFGVGALVFGLRNRQLVTPIAPLGALAILAGSLRLFARHFPNRIVLPLAAIAAVALLVWFVREARALKRRV